MLLAAKRRRLGGPLDKRTLAPRRRAELRPANPSRSRSAGLALEHSSDPFWPGTTLCVRTLERARGESGRLAKLVRCSMTGPAGSGPMAAAVLRSGRGGPAASRNRPWWGGGAVGTSDACPLRLVRPGGSRAARPRSSLRRMWQYVCSTGAALLAKHISVSAPISAPACRQPTGRCTAPAEITRSADGHWPLARRRQPPLGQAWSLRPRPASTS